MLITALSGCVMQMEHRYDPEQAAYVNMQGNSTLRGQVYYFRSDGGIVYSKRRAVTLYPVIPFTTELFADRFSKGKFASFNEMLSRPGVLDLQSIDHMIKNLNHVKTDHEGNFVFENLHAGEYYVYGSVHWTERLKDHGGYLLDHVIVPENGEVEIVLNGHCALSEPAPCVPIRSEATAAAEAQVN